MPAVYRIEVCPNNRAGCQNSECKKQGIKIQKGELRFGTLIEINEHQSWQYKHWGCVTPVNCHTWQEITTGDTDMVDGYDELPKDFQDKVKRAIEQGHVDDEDWKGDIEKNRPGQKGFRSPKKKQQNDAEVVSDAEGSPTKDKKSKAKKRKVDDENEDEEADEELAEKKKGRGRPKKDKDESKAAKTSDDAPKKGRGRPKKGKDAEGDDNDTAPPAKKAKKAAKATDNDADDGEPEKKKKKARGRPKKTESD